MSAEPKRRVAFITGQYPKASETFLLRELRALAARGLDFVIVATGRLPDIAEAKGISVPVLLRPSYFSSRSLAAELAFGCSHPLRYCELLFGLYRGHWRRPRELFQVMLNVPRALAVGRELRRLGVRRVHALWASLPATLGWIIARAFDMEFSFAAHARDVYVDGRMLKEKAALARHVMMCSEVSAAHLKGIVGEDLARKITIVRHGIDIEKLPARAEKPTDMILAAGRFEPKKGFDVLIEACRILARRGRHLHCTIVGEGPLQKHLEDLVARSGVTGIELKPWMNHDALMDLVAQAGVVVTPSVVASSGDRDGVPNILLEAMAIGTPVVASAVGGVGEVVHDGETGHLVAPGDAEHLADAIEAALAEGTTAGQETGKMSEKSASARELIRREYALPDTVQTLERLLTD